MPAYDDIKTLVSIISAKREPFNHHGSRVAAYAMNLASALKLPANEVELIEIGAHLHDIGKILIRYEILNFTGKFNDVQRAEMETHADLGWSLVSEAGYDQVVLDIVRHHHEWWNGKGYPDGLKGDEIPIGAQIAGICDCYEALTNDRVYRTAKSHPVAMAYMQKDRRTKFNPELIDLFFARIAK